MLYNFENLDIKLDQLGFPKITSSGVFKVIRTNFQKAYEADKIVFRDDGIYLIHEGNAWKGYMYMPTYRVKKYNSFSRFHLTRCSIIEDFISGGMFDSYYQWSNHSDNDIKDRDTNELHKNKKLNLCSKCISQMIKTNISDTVDFFETLDKEEKAKVDVLVDIFGYVKDKEKISKGYRQKKNFICEKCSTQPKNSLHKRWWHTHHIDGDKTNNNPDNLKCLCILCHSNVDKKHQLNFSKGAIPIQIASFKKEYNQDLIKNKNPYL